MGTMSLRFLFGMLSFGMQDHHNDSERMVVVEAEGVNQGQIIYIDQGAVKFHIGMLTISLIIGLAYAGFVVYTWWMEKDVFLGYIRNLVISLVCRTFFSILFDGVILLGSLFNVGGGNTLTAFEQIFVNLVLGFWLSLTIYAHARVQRNFKSEPTLRLYQYGIPVVAFFFAFVWIMLLQQHNPIPQVTWWVILNPFTQWIVNSANLLFLLIQLGLVADMCRMMAVTKSSLDNDSVSLLWKVAAILGALVLIFWFQFGFSLGLYGPTQSYLYFFYLIDGMECALVCVCLYFFNKWVALLINNKSIQLSGPEESVIAPAQSHEEGLLNGGRGIVTIDSMLASRENIPGYHPAEDANDVVYSNVVESHRLQKTLELYKRFNVIQKQVTVVEGEEFYDCQIPIEYERAPQHGLATHQNVQGDYGLKTERISELTQKRNAFYASKYLILDSKEGEIPTYLETRPSVSSMSEKDSQKEERTSRIDIPASLDVAELVRKWLKDSSEIREKNKKEATPTEQEQPKGLGMEIPEPKVSKSVSETAADGQDTFLHQDRPPENTFFRKEGRELDKEKSELLGPSEQNSHLEIDSRIESVQEVLQEKVDKDFMDNSQKMALKTEHDLSISTKNEPATIAEEMKKHTPVPTESVLGQSPSDSKSIEKPEEPSKNVEVTPVSTTVDEADAEVRPKQPTPLITYSELLEFRSNRDSEYRPQATKQSLTESVFSTIDSLINVGGSFFNSLTGFSQAEHELYPKQDVRFPDGSSPTDDLKSKPEVQHAEKLKEEEQTPAVPTPQLGIRYDEAKASNLPRFQTSPEEPMTCKPTVGEDGIRLESKLNHPREYPWKELKESNKGIKNDDFEKAEFVQHMAINEPFNVRPDQERKVVPVPDNLINSHMATFKTPPNSELTMDKKLSSDLPAEGLSEPIQKPLQEQPSNDLISPNLLKKLDSSGSEKLNEPKQNLQQDQLPIELISNLREKSDSPEYLVRQCGRIKPLENQPSNEQIIPELREKSDSEFTMEKRLSSSSSEFSVERLRQPLQNLQPEKFSDELTPKMRGKSDSELTKEKRLSSSSEFSIEEFSKPVQKSLKDQRSNVLIPELRQKSDPRLSFSSNSSSDFAIEEYYTKVMNDTQKIKNQLGPLHPARKSKEPL